MFPFRVSSSVTYNRKAPRVKEPGMGNYPHEFLKSPRVKETGNNAPRSS